jgi:ferredoxin-type protein NapH
MCNDFKMVVSRRQSIRRTIILITFLLFPVVLNYLSPYLIIDSAAQGIINGSFIVFGLLFVFSLVLGRAWCSWVCPAAGVQELCFSIKNSKTKGGKYNWIKFYIWFPWIASIALVVALAGGYKTVNPLYMIESGISVAEPGNYIIYFSVLALIIVPALTIGKRAFCHYICWMSPFMIIGTSIRNALKWPALHLKANASSCKNCKSCNEVCPMSLDVNKMVQQGDMRNTECILCGTCVDNCPNNSIKFGWK